MRAEEPLNHGDLVCEEKAESHASQAGCESQAIAKTLGVISDEAKRGRYAHGNKHHASNCPQAKDEKVCDRPTGFLDRRQDQQHHGG